MTLSAHSVSPWTADEVRDVLAAFGLGEPAGGSDPLRLAGWDSQRARCTAETRGGTWFLKKHHPSVHRPEQHAVIRALRALGGRAPEIMATPDGETWHRESGGGWYAEVHRVVPGEPPEQPSDALGLDAAEQVALWHRVSVDLVPGEWEGWYVGADAVDLCRETERILREHSLADTAVTEMLRAEAEDLAASIGEEAGETEADGGHGELTAAGTSRRNEEFDHNEQTPKHGQPRSVVHADMWRGNWVADNGRIAALTDFDWVHRGTRLEDLADVVLAFGSDRDTPPNQASVIDGANAIDTRRVFTMVERYEREAGILDGMERAALPGTLRSAWVRHFAWIVQKTPEHLYLEVALSRAASFALWLRSEFRV